MRPARYFYIFSVRLLARLGLVDQTYPVVIHRNPAVILT